MKKALTVADLMAILSQHDQNAYVVICDEQWGDDDESYNSNRDQMQTVWGVEAGYVSEFVPDNMNSDLSYDVLPFDFPGGRVACAGYGYRPAVRILGCQDEQLPDHKDKPTWTEGAIVWNPKPTPSCRGWQFLDGKLVEFGEEGPPRPPA
jgi:hypothetical protein